jgi:hypothetical protein
VFLPARPITQADPAALAERVRRRVIRWFRLSRLLDAAAAADMLAWENSRVSIDASVRITLFRLHLRVSCQRLEHLLRSFARPPFALERLSVIRGPDGRITRVRYVLPRHKAATWVGPGVPADACCGPEDGARSSRAALRAAHQPENGCGGAIGQTIPPS